jgi:hypothetical protein
MSLIFEPGTCRLHRGDSLLYSAPVSCPIYSCVPWLHAIQTAQLKKCVNIERQSMLSYCMSTASTAVQWIQSVIACTQQMFISHINSSTLLQISAKQMWSNSCLLLWSFVPRVYMAVHLHSCTRKHKVGSIRSYNIHNTTRISSHRGCHVRLSACGLPRVGVATSELPPELNK